MHSSHKGTITNRLLWHSRRGLLELDLLFVPFFCNCYHTLDADMQKSYQDLLTQEDPHLLAWCVHDQAPPVEFTAIIQAIQTYAKTGNADSPVAR